MTDSIPSNQPIGDQRAEQGAMAEKQELVDALKLTTDALQELMACSTDLLNSRVAKGLYKQCHEASLAGCKLLAAEGYYKNTINQQRPLKRDGSPAWTF